MDASELERYTAATHRHFRLIALRGGGTAAEEAGILLLAGPHPGATILNSAFRTDPGVSPEAVLRRARAFYDPTAHYAVFASEHRDADLIRAAEAAGWQRVVELPAMALRGDVPPAEVTGAVLRPVDPARDRATFAAIATPPFADDELEAAAYPIVFDHPAVYEPPCGAVIAELDGRPAACAWYVVTDAVATVGFVATLGEFRRRGLGTLVTAAVCRMALDAGATLVTLQASPAGFPVYARMGFETISREILWAGPPA